MLQYYFGDTLFLLWTEGLSTVHDDRAA